MRGSRDGSMTTFEDIAFGEGIPCHNGWAATSTAVMYRPGKILQVRGVEADFENDWDPRDGLETQIVDITAMVPGAPANLRPKITYGPRIKHKRQWANVTVLPDGKVVLMGGSEHNVLDHQGVNDDDPVPTAPAMPAPSARPTACATDPATRAFHLLQRFGQEEAVIGYNKFLTNGNLPRKARQKRGPFNLF